MTVAKEYWNIPKPSDDFLMAQGTNLTVFVDHADNALVWGLGASDVTAIAGVFIAFFALGVSVWQWFSASKQNRLMVTPHIILTYETDVDSQSFGVSIANNGVGPAVINKCTLIVSGKELNSDEGIKEYLKECFAGSTDISVSLMSGYPYFLSTTKPKHTLLNVTIVKSDMMNYEEVYQLLNKYLELVRVDCDYSDIYGNKMPK